MQAFFNTSKPVWFCHSWILYSLNKILYRKIIELIRKNRSLWMKLFKVYSLLKKNEKIIVPGTCQNCDNQSDKDVDFGPVLILYDL